VKEKTLYDVLGVGRDASSADIQTAYETLRQHCEANVAGLSDEDRRIRLAALRQAHETLSDNVSKAIYDAKLGGRPLPPSWAGAVGAEAVLAGDGLTKPAKETNWLAVGIWVLLGIVGIWLVMQVVYVSIMSRYVTANHPPADASAQERAVIQDYYQETGVRAASKAEVEMLRAADRKAEQERRQQDQAQRDKEKAERDYQRFVEDGRRLGDQVSSQVRSEELRQKREEERERREAEETARREREAEQDRIERERNRWRSVINDPR
jgi:curved DNA-binding protein CbpA